jgi:hypothetical protein
LVADDAYHQCPVFDPCRDCTLCHAMGSSRSIVSAYAEGDWAKVQVTQTGKDVIFEGIIEVYNKSSRANTIRDYAFFRKHEQGWEAMAACSALRQDWDGQPLTVGMAHASNGPG